MPSSEAGRSSVVAIVEVCLMDRAELPKGGMDCDGSFFACPHVENRAAAAPRPEDRQQGLVLSVSSSAAEPGFARREPCRPGRYQRELPGFQSVSVPGFAVRARMKSRSESRFR